MEQNNETKTNLLFRWPDNVEGIIMISDIKIMKE